MGKQRYVDTKFWDDNYIVECDPIEKLLYLYLLTNTLTNILGVYEISIRRIAFDTGIDKDMVIKILERFEESGKIRYSEGYIAIKNFVKHQANNPKINKGIELLLEETSKDLIKWIDIDFNRLDIEEDSLCIGLDKTPKDSNYSNSNSNSNTNSKKISFNYNTGKFINLTEECKSELKKRYPKCNINKEIKKMTDWLLDNVNRKRQGKRSFINNWLEKTQKNNQRSQSLEKDSMPVLTDHLRKEK